MNWIRTENFKIRGYEVGADGLVPVQSLCAYMEEAASLHAAGLGLSVEALQAHGLTWALARMQLELYDLPSVEDLVRVKTWPAGVDKLQYRRDFLISGSGVTSSRTGQGEDIGAGVASGQIDERGERILARAITDWVVIGLTSRRLERVPQFISALQPPVPEQVMEKAKLHLEEQDSAPELLSFRVRKSDIDRNRHVNNVRFLDWILESVPEEVSAGRRLAGLQVMYRAEALYGDTVLARGSAGSACKDAGVKVGSNASADAHCNVVEFSHGLYRCSDRQELVRAKTIWK